MSKTLPHNHTQNTENIIDIMPCPECFMAAATLFSQLGDGSRLKILWLLCHSEECVSNIAAAMEMSAASVSHHLKNLKVNGLISSRREGKEIHYSLADTPQARYANKILDEYFIPDSDGCLNTQQSCFPNTPKCPPFIRKLKKKPDLSE